MLLHFALAQNSGSSVTDVKGWRRATEALISSILQLAMEHRAHHFRCEKAQVGIRKGGSEFRTAPLLHHGDNLHCKMVFSA